MAELVDAHDSKSCFARSESSILSSPTKNFMKLNNYNNLLELFQSRYQSENKNEIFLQSLKDKDLKFTWKQTYDCIQKLSNQIQKYITSKDRCLLICISLWWAKRESNSHFLQNTILSRARLPVPPFALNFSLLYL